MHSGRGERSVHDAASDVDAARARRSERHLARDVQMPSLDFSRSLTACGLALPPDDFITWPTNQPIELRLGLGLRDLVGIGGDDLVDHLLDRADVGDLLHAARFDQRAGIAALLPDDLEQVLGDLAGDGALADQVDDGAELRRRHRRAPKCPGLPC